MAGQVTINGSYSGETSLRRIARPVRFDSTVTNVRMDALPGELRLTLNQLSLDNAAGPIEVRTKSKDVELAGINGAIKVTTERGDVAIRQSTAPIHPIEVEVKSGNIDFALPPASSLNLRAETARGVVVNDFNPALKEEQSDRGAVLSGTLGAGPEVRLKTGRGEVSVRKIAPIETGTQPPARKAPAKVEEPRTEKDRKSVV